MKIDHYSIALRVLSRQAAMKAVKADLWSRGVKLSYVPMNEIRSLTNAYLDEHLGELLARAAHIIATDPKRFGCAKLRTGAQNQKPRKSTTSTVHISGAK